MSTLIRTLPLLLLFACAPDAPTDEPDVETYKKDIAAKLAKKHKEQLARQREKAAAQRAEDARKRAEAARLRAEQMKNQPPVNFEKQILPLLEARCFKCHSSRPKEPRSGLRLDGKNWILYGGEKEGAAVLAGEPVRSPLYDRASLYYEDERVMPPDGKTYRSKELELIKRWILEGADFGDWVGAGGIDAPKPGAPPRKPAARPREIIDYAAIAKGLEQPDAAAIAALRARNVEVSPVSSSSPLLSVNFPEDAESLALLAPLRMYVTILELPDAKLSDKDMAEIGRLPNLTKLELDDTPITDAGLALLAKAGLGELRHLDLDGTSVTDAGLVHALAFKKLRVLTVRKSKVTLEGAMEFAKAHTRFRVEWQPKTKPQQAAADDDNDDDK